jgi:hypothetical protein
MLKKSKRYLGTGDSNTVKIVAGLQGKEYKERCAELKLETP